MCEVEFWEVFYGKNKGFIVVTLYPLVDCRIGDPKGASDESCNMNHAIVLGIFDFWHVF